MPAAAATVGVGAAVFLEAVGGDSKNCPSSASSQTASIVLRRFPFFSCAFFLTFAELLDDASMDASPLFCCARGPLLVLNEGSVLIRFLPFGKVGTSPGCPLVTFFRGGMSG